MSFGFGVGDFIAVLDKAKLYRERFADAPDHFDSLSREIESLASILEYIGSIEEQLEDTEKEQLAPAIKESVKLLGELEKIHNDNTSLDQSSGTTKLAALKPRAIWSRLRLKPEDVQKLRLRISLNVAFLGAIKGFRDSEAIHATKQVVVSMHDEQTSRQRREILDWLTTTDYASQQRDHLSRRYAGTNEWLLESEEYKSWLSEKSKTLLCPGMPGAGKTVMASTVVDELMRRFQNDPDVGVAYIYCNFKDQERQNHQDLIANLAKQLAQSRLSLPSSLKEMYETHQRSRTPMSLQETSDLLQVIASSYRRLFVVIDALDECETKSRRALLSEVFRLQQRQTTNILATTRQIPEIIDSDCFQGSVSLQVSALDADVSRYISSRLPDMQSFVQKRPELQEEIRKGILDNINGMFLLAKLLIESLSCKTNPKAVRKTLAAVTSEDDTYSYFYEEALKRIRVQPPAHVELANQVLSWIVFSRRPLEVLELQHALAFEEGETEVDEDNISPVEMIISACAGLVTLDDEGGIIRLVHQTTQEFFTRRRSTLFPDVNAEMATTCVRYLCLGQIRQLSRDQHWHIPPWRSPLFLEFPTSKIFRKARLPFYDYATLHWGDHTRETDELPAGVEEFLSNQDMLIISMGVLEQLVDERAPSKGAYLAAWFGLLKVFETQEYSGRNVNVFDWKCHTALLWAARRGHSSLVEFFLKDNHTASDNVRLRPGSRCMKQAIRKPNGRETFQQALYEAVEKDHKAVVEMLVKFGFDHKVEFEGNDGSSLLSICLEKGDICMMKIPLGSDSASKLETTITVNIPTRCGVDIEKPQGWGRTPLAIAASTGLHDAVELLLEHQAKIQVRDIYGRTPLSLAAEQDDTSSLKLLLEHGADTEAHDAFGQSPLFLAARWDSVQSLHLLLKYGANTETKDKNEKTPLLMAVENGAAAKEDTLNPSSVQLLLQYGANTEARDKYKRTLLFATLEEGISSKEDTIRSLQVLLDHGADIEAQDQNKRTPLSVTAEADNTHYMQFLLDHGANTEAQDNQKRTPLLVACGESNTKTVDLLLNYGSNVEARDASNKTPLLLAAARGLVPIIKSLVKSGADLEGRGTDWAQTPLSLAAFLGQESSVKALLGFGADPNARDIHMRTPLALAVDNRQSDPKDRYACIVAMLETHGIELDCRDAKGQTPLLAAAGSGQVLEVKALLEYGADITSQDHSGRTALLCAAENNRTSVVPILLKHGANVEDRDHSGRTALSHAINNGMISIATMLLKYGADLGHLAHGGSTALLRAVNSGMTSIASMLLDHGADMKYRDESGRTALLDAVHNGMTSMVSILLSHGADVEDQDQEGRTPLSLAASYGPPSILNELLQQGAIIESRDHRRRTPIWHAAACNNLSSLKALIDRGADIECRDDDGATPLMKAAMFTADAVTEVLLRGGAKVESCDNFGQTALLEAMRSPFGGDLGWKALLAYGADPAVKDKRGRTPLWWAMSTGRSDAVSRLLSLTTRFKVGDTNGLSFAMAFNFGSRRTWQRQIHRLLHHVSAFGPQNNDTSGLPFPVTTQKALDYVEMLLSLGISSAYIHTVSPMQQELRHIFHNRNRLVMYLNSTDDAGLKALWDSPELVMNRSRVSGDKADPAPDELPLLKPRSDHSRDLITVIQANDEDRFNRLLVHEERLHQQVISVFASDCELEDEETEQNPLVCALQYGRMSMVQGLVKIGAEFGILLEIKGMNEALERMMGI